MKSKYLTGIWKIDWKRKQKILNDTLRKMFWNFSGKFFKVRIFWMNYCHVFRVLNEFDREPEWPIFRSLQFGDIWLAERRLFFDVSLSSPTVRDPSQSRPFLCLLLCLRSSCKNFLLTSHRSQSQKQIFFFKFSRKWPKLAKPDLAPKFKRRSTPALPRM